MTNLKNNDEKIEYIFNINFRDLGLYFTNLSNIESIIYINKNNENVIFNKTQFAGCTSYYFVDNQKKFFLKIPSGRADLNCNFLKYDILKREIYLLKILNKYDKYFPKLIDHNDYGIIIEYIGDILDEKNIPSNILSQVEEIINILKLENISHCDIKKEELLVKDNILHIVDWGWATINNDWGCGIGLCQLEKPFLNKDSDLKCILKIISEYLL